MSDIPTSRSRVSRHPVVKNPDTNNKQGIITKNNMKIAKKGNQRRATMLVRFDHELTIKDDDKVGYPHNRHDPRTPKTLPVIQF